MKKLLTIFNILIVSIQLHATNEMRLTGGEVPAGGTIHIALHIDNSSPFVAFQADIPIPAAFSYVEGSALLDDNRKADHSLSAQLVGGNILRIISYSMSNASFQGSSGAVMQFTLQAGAAPGSYSLELQSPVIAGTSGTNILTAATAGQLLLKAPAVQLSAGQLNFGRVPLTSTSTLSLQLSNAGNLPLNVTDITFDSPWFELEGNPSFSLDPGHSRSLLVRFSAVEKGDFLQQMSLHSNDPARPAVTAELQATAFAVNELHCGSMLSFSGSRGMLTFSINNMEDITAFQFDLQLPQPLSYVEGSASLSEDRKTDHQVMASMVSASTLRVVAFSPSNQPLQGDDGQVLQLTFDVLGTGGWYPLNLTQVILSGAEAQNIVSAFTHGSLQVAAPDIHTQGSLSFGDVSLLETGSQSLRIWNYGSDVLRITELKSSHEAFFTQQTLPVEIAVHQHFDLEVFFHHPVKGPRQAVLEIFSNDPDENPFPVTLTATSYAPNFLRVQEVFAQPQQDIFVDILADNHEDFTAFEFKLHFPQDALEFLPTGSQLTERAADHSLHAALLAPGQLQVFGFSMSQKNFSDKTGSIVRLAFRVKNPQLGSSYALQLADAILADAAGNNILYNALGGSLRVVEPLVCPQAVTLCLEAPPLVLAELTTEGGEFSGPGVSNGLFYPGLAAAGTHSIRFTRMEGSVITGSCEFEIRVNPLPEVSLQAFAAICADAPAFALSGGSPLGGTYSGTGVNAQGIFDPAVSGPGTFEITYTYTDANGCTASATKPLTVNPLPEVSLQAFAAICADAPAFALSGGSPTGGTYSGTGMNAQGIFDPSDSGPGTFDITYTYTDANGCSAFATKPLTVNPLPVIRDLEVKLCGEDLQDQALADLTGYVAFMCQPENLSFRYFDATGQLLSDPQQTLVSDGDVFTVEATSPGGCTATALLSFSMEVLELQDQTISLCDQSDDGSRSLLGVSLSSFNQQLYPQGPGLSFSWHRVSEPDTEIILPVTITDGDKYLFRVQLGECQAIAEVSFVVHPLPEVAFTSTSLCEGAEPIDLVPLASPQGGSFEGTGVSGNHFDSQVSGTGHFLINYTFTSQEGCSNTASTSLQVHPKPQVSFVPPVQMLCLNHQPLQLTGGLPLGGIYEGPGVNQGYLNPAAAGAGNHQISYLYTDQNNCNNQAFAQILVDPCTAAPDPQLEDAFLLYPNPARDVIYLKLDNSMLIRRLELLQAGGRLLMAQNNPLQNTTLAFSIGHLTPGVYIFRIITEREVVTRNVVVY